MKTQVKLPRFAWWAALGAALWLGQLAGRAQGTPGKNPSITKVYLDGPEVVVSVQVPAGVKKVTLESRTRLGAGTWVPRAVQRIQDTSQLLVFRLARSEKLEVLRVRGDAEEALPAAFYTGTNRFNGQLSTADPGKSQGVRGPLEWVNDAAPGAAPGGATRQVVESDIWKVEGDTLYFFNQYRGLQVIDLTQPDAPVVRGTLALAAAGEQMYVLDGQHVLLLARNGCGWTPEQGSQALVVDVGGADPKVVGSVTILGDIQESRLVGTALYVASQAYRKIIIPPKPGETQPTEQWEWGSVISSADLSQPATPVAKDTLWYSGYGNVITATDKFLLVSYQNAGNTGNWWQSELRLIDISAPDGAMLPLGALQPAGRVADKFKMNVSGTVLTIISETWDPRGVNGRASVLETYSLAEPQKPVKLGELRLGHGEGLYATRFDGDRVYLVTFLRIDPLWVVDLKDPTNPTISGELRVPGWSTYIHPLGDRLVTIGIDNSNSWKVAVSLFDVRDATKPALLAKTPLGESSSWSEANSDEKALSVLPEAGLILVPYQTWGTNGYAAAVQMIDLGQNTLAPRGVIHHQLQPRRATLHGERVVSISGRELLVVNAANRDTPVVTADLELSWPVDRVLLSGDYLLELANGTDWQGQPDPVVRVARVADPNRLLGRATTGINLPIVGASIHDGKLYLAQAQTSMWWWWPGVRGQDGQDPDPTKTPTLYLSVLELGSLPELKLLGQTGAVIADLGWGANWQVLWPKPGVVVLSSGGGWFWPLMDLSPVWGGGRGFWRPWWGGGGGSGRLFAFDVNAPTTPKFTSDLNLASTNQWWSFSDAFLANGLVYLSHQGSEFLPGVRIAGQPDPSPIITIGPDGTPVTNKPPVGVWVTRYYLDVVDYADPTTPTVRKPVNLPSTLQGVGRGGALLYTSGWHYDPTGNSDGAQFLDASAYDGVEAVLVTSLKLPNTWPQPLLVLGDVAWLGRTEAYSASSSLEAWTVTDAGQFALLGTKKLSSPAQTLAAYGTLLAAQFGQGIELYDVANPAAAQSLGGATPSGCVWPDLTTGDGSTARGLWLPLQDYGVFALPIAPKP